MLRVIEALVQNDEAKRCFLTCRDIDPGHHALDGQNSVDKCPVTVWEMLAEWWNGPDFNPVTEIVINLHSDFLQEIDLWHEIVASMHNTTPEYIKHRFQSMMVTMKHGIANWELSGMGDGGHDYSDFGDNENDDESRSEYQEGHENFGSINGCNRTRLSNHHTFFEFNQTYVLYAWHMLEKHGLLRYHFSC